MSIIQNSQATGAVAGISNLGGLIGYDAGFNQILQLLGPRTSDRNHRPRRRVPVGSKPSLTPIT